MDHKSLATAVYLLNNHEYCVIWVMVYVIISIHAGIFLFSVLRYLHVHTCTYGSSIIVEI